MKIIIHYYYIIYNNLSYFARANVASKVYKYPCAQTRRLRLFCVKLSSDVSITAEIHWNTVSDMFYLKGNNKELIDTVFPCTVSIIVCATVWYIAIAISS